MGGVVTDTSERLVHVRSRCSRCILLRRDALCRKVIPKFATQLKRVCSVAANIETGAKKHLFRMFHGLIVAILSKTSIPL
jgi:hypothetical protein